MNPVLAGFLAWPVVAIPVAFVVARMIARCDPCECPPAPVVPAGDLLDSPRAPLTPAELGEFAALTNPLEAERDRRLS